MKPIAIAITALFAVCSQASVSFVYSSSDAAFVSLPIYDDFSGVFPRNTGRPAFVSKSITYGANTNDIGVWQGSQIAQWIASTEVPAFLVTADGDENFTIHPDFAIRRMGFETYTINEAGNPLSVIDAPNVLVIVHTASGDTPLSLNPPPNNHGFLGIISSEPIVSVKWIGMMGGIKDTGITNIRVADAVPEPASLVGLGAGFLLLLRRRR